MRILIDIGHPAHVHYFKHFIRLMKERGGEVCVTARDREMIQYLLNFYKIPFFNRGKGGEKILGKLLYLLKGDYFVYKTAKKFKPDVVLSFASSYAAHASFLLRKPHIAFDDTEHALFEHLMYIPFTNLILTPRNFRKNFGKKQKRFDGSMDLSYLHFNYFQPNADIFKYLGINEDDKFVFMRFVSWSASHDIGQKGVTAENKIKAVKSLSKICKVYISSEEELPDEIKKYELKIPYEMIHDVLYFANLFWGESGTMATEACILGTPAINIATSALLVGVFDEFVNNKLLYIIPDNIKAIEKAVDLLKDKKYKDDARLIANKMVAEKINVTQLLIWLVENYPRNKKLIKKILLFDNQTMKNIND